MTVFLLVLVLATALMHASWNAIVKVVSDRLVSLALVNFTHTLIALAALPFVGLPNSESWPYLIASVVIHQAYYAGLVMQYRFGDLGQVYPLARGASPLLVAAAAWIWAGEALGPGALMAILLITGGIMYLALSGRGQGGNRLAVAWALFTALTIAGYSVADGLGGRAAGDTLAYIVWLFLLDGLPLPLVLPLLRGPVELAASLRRYWLPGLFGGVLSSTAYGVVIWVMSLAPLAIVTALRETSVIAAALIGMLFLSEPFGGRRILATCLVALGIAVLQFS
ncbi:MAG: EamA family transporter [Alphaproteobacteria bacterium]|jgi:drug/metabolite transporter (DMT)-like permease|nr:EamA family transporter [Rhodospirillaceae bacterium]MDP6021699.1 EamA family transporter [Alphaproteobacteria bacterium]MDP6257357.1 EamA family transporter [Alphaproteobacteria bacterium]MDP7055292.1 EamA family transporter [Alphaproteobacteria bacterium]MDP7229049.1 EamA family transporter [Alphaproteobacteria bacterium]|tara:strand:+ start:744 stop:1586 length:843 start_codon:yes stop_codon:yes gene_type:complete